MTFLKAIKILKKDPVFYTIIEPCKEQVELRFNAIKGNGDLYVSLLQSIVSQQLSTKAANTIYGRFINLFKNNIPEAQLILKLDDDQLRAVGLSYQKISYIKAVANYSLQKNLTNEYFGKLSNEEIIEELSTIKGVGKWTVEMILIFALKRLDVFPYDDLIVRNSMIKKYDLTNKGKQLKADCHQLAENWKPYRSIASLFLWEAKNL